MMIIGCDFHPSWQQVSWLDTETGETGERKLVQASGDAERFYRQVAAPALIGMEATGNCHWLVDLLSELGHKLWVGDALQISTGEVHGYLATPVPGSESAALAPQGQTRRSPKVVLPANLRKLLRQRLGHRYHIPGLGTPRD